MKTAYLIVCEEDHPDYPTIDRNNLCCFLDSEKADEYLKELTNIYSYVLLKIQGFCSGQSYFGLTEEFESKYLSGNRFSRELSFHIETVEVKD